MSLIQIHGADRFQPLIRDRLANATESERERWLSWLSYKHANHRAWVIFENGNDITLLRRVLKDGYKHCWILLWDGRQWITVDSLSSHIEVMTYNDIMDGLDLPMWLKDRYTAVVEIPLRRDGEKELYIRWLSCVEIAKHYLGIKAFGVITPYQLYKHLLRNGGKHARDAAMEDGKAEPAAAG